jgi:hypothetical protein
MSRTPMEPTMKAIIIATALAVLSAVPAIAVEKIPQQFVGEWCVDQQKDASKLEKQINIEEGITIYSRSRKCNDKDKLVLRADKAFIASVVECASPKIVSITRHGTHRLKYRCSNLNGETWTWETFLSVPGPNQLAVQKVKE